MSLSGIALAQHMRRTRLIPQLPKQSITKRHILPLESSLASGGWRITCRTRVGVISSDHVSPPLWLLLDTLGFLLRGAQHLLGVLRIYPFGLQGLIHLFLHDSQSPGLLSLFVFPRLACVCPFTCEWYPLILSPWALFLTFLPCGFRIPPTGSRSLLLQGTVSCMHWSPAPHKATSSLPLILQTSTPKGNLMTSISPLLC